MLLVHVGHNLETALCFVFPDKPVRMVMHLKRRQWDERVIRLPRQTRILDG